MLANCYWDNNRLSGNCIPQGLKPCLFVVLCGTAEAVPFHNAPTRANDKQLRPLQESLLLP